MNSSSIQHFHRLLTKMEWALKNNRIKSINDGLINFYGASGYVALKTADEWEKQGRCVVKGSTERYLLDENNNPYPVFGLCQTKAIKNNY